MIAYLSGKLLLKLPNSVIIDVGGVGYEVTIPVTTFYEVGEVGSILSLKIHTHVREDVIQLFGFWTIAEKELFLRLTTVSGIGPKLAITMISGMAAAELIRAIRSNDLGRLTTIPGVGRKTAERVVVELRDKINSVPIDETEAGLAAAATAGASEADTKDDAVAALMALGYPKPQAERAVEQALREDGERTIEALLKRSLKRLSR